MRSMRSRLSSWLSIAGRLCFAGAIIVGILEIAGWMRYARWPHYTLSNMTHTMAVSGLGSLGAVETIVNEVLYAPAWVTLVALGLLLRALGGIASLGGNGSSRRE